MKKRVTKDFETRSKCDLKKHGAYLYSLDPTTQPTCLAFKLHGVGGEVILLNFEEINRPWKNHSKLIREAWSYYVTHDFEFSAHNSYFERCIYDNIMVKRYGWPEIDPRLRRCTAAKAAACALPRSLAGAGEAMKLITQKDYRGYAAMMATCKPTRQWKAWHDLQEKIASGARITEKSRQKAKLPEPKVFLDPEDAPDVWQVLYDYCVIDVRAEEELDDALPDLIPKEQEIWFLNQELNWRGLRIDIPTVKKIVGIMGEESKKKLKELDSLTMGLVTKPNSVKSIMAFLEIEGVKLPNLRKQTVEDKLNDFDLSKDMHRLLELRKALSLTSTNKYKSFIARAGSDNRVRDILMYHGASTGRDTGTGIQPHNFPRGIIKISKDRPYAHVENVIECEPEMLQLLYGPSLSMLFSSILRNMIVPSKGHELFVADFSKIEVAVCWWLADNKPGLKILNAGLDPYIYMAAANTGRPYQDFNDESPERQLGKAQVLGCQFGMQGDKFHKTAWDMHRLKLTRKQSILAVQNYRKANPRVPELWKEYEKAAVDAVENAPLVFGAGHCKFFLNSRFLWIELPSGRRLAYREPQLAMRYREFDKPVLDDDEEPILDKQGNPITEKVITGPHKTLEFWAVNSKTKKWNVERTWGGTLTENLVQAIARDLMMLGILRLEKSGYKALLTVHDEALCEKPKGEGDLKEFVEILCSPPKWADGCPIQAKGWKGPRYRK